MLHTHLNAFKVSTRVLDFKIAKIPTQPKFRDKILAKNVLFEKEIGEKVQDYSNHGLN